MSRAGYLIYVILFIAVLAVSQLSFQFSGCRVESGTKKNNFMSFFIRTLRPELSELLISVKISIINAAVWLKFSASENDWVKL